MHLKPTRQGTQSKGTDPESAREILEGILKSEIIERQIGSSIVYQESGRLRWIKEKEKKMAGIKFVIVKSNIFLLTGLGYHYRYSTTTSQINNFDYCSCAKLPISRGNTKLKI